MLRSILGLKFRFQSTENFVKIDFGRMIEESQQQAQMQSDSFNRNSRQSFVYFNRIKRRIKSEIRLHSLKRLPRKLKQLKIEPISPNLFKFRKCRDHNFSLYQNISKSDWLLKISEEARTYSPEAIPLTIKMGSHAPEVHTIFDSLPSSGNIELLKVPNFLHLTPQVVRKQCEILKKHLIPFPKDLPLCPLVHQYESHVYAGIDVEHPDTYKITTIINVDHLNLDRLSSLKIKFMAGSNYNVITNCIEISSKECPARHQNFHYNLYRLLRLFNEARKVNDEDKKQLNSIDDLEFYFIRESNLKQNNINIPDTLELELNGKKVRFNQVGYPFIYADSIFGRMEPKKLDDVFRRKELLNYDSKEFQIKLSPANYVKLLDHEIPGFVKLETGRVVKLFKGGDNKFEVDKL